MYCFHDDIWQGGPVGMHQEKSCLGCISETISCRKFILIRDISWGGGGEYQCATSS